MSLRDWARRLKRDIVALWLAARDSRTPALAKWVCLAVAAYALSPIDLVPDFIPILGLVDDLILLPAGIWVAVRLIPPPLLAELRRRATVGDLPPSRVAGAIILGVWLVALAAFTWVMI